MSNKKTETNETCMGLSNLISLYEIIMNAQIQYSQRVWTLFNWFLTIHIGIAGFYLIQNVESSSFTLIPIIALIISTLWIFIGYEDYNSMNKHNKKRKAIEDEVIAKIKDCIELTKPNRLGEDDKSARITKIRQTWALVIFPIIVFVFWLVLFFN